MTGASDSRFTATVFLSVPVMKENRSEKREHSPVVDSYPAVASPDLHPEHDRERQPGRPTAPQKPVSAEGPAPFDIAETTFSTPIGNVTVCATAECVVEVRIADAGRRGQPRVRPTGHRVLDLATQQIAEYFRARRSTFDVPLAPEPETFEGRVRTALRNVPLGHTVTYRELALAAGNAKAVRAAGNAVRRNRILILVPSHRVLSSIGELTGFDGGSGITTKRLLLTAEGAWFRETKRTA